jgi:eukaryotic-like serine/threonine-protein kinase
VTESREVSLEDRVGKTLRGKWRVEALLDSGAMGAVYRARHENGHSAAIKVLHVHLAIDPEMRKRFQLEGYVANKIGHPGAVRIIGHDTAEDGAPFLVMELLEGEPLSAWFARADRIPVPDALAICGQLLEVLAAAHAADVLHRDIKPANVFLTRHGHVKLLDFGLARVRVGAKSVVPTAHGLALGTPHYMSPEQARGKKDEVDARSDLFSVGALLFRAVSGHRIHHETKLGPALMAAASRPAPALATVMPSAGPLLRRAVDKALAFDQADRWPSARDMLDALRGAYDESKGKSVVGPTPENPPASPPEHEPSLVIDVAFGDDHDEALKRERARTEEAISDLS